MRKVELSLKEKQKYKVIKKLVETNGNKERARRTQKMPGKEKQKAQKERPGRRKKRHCLQLRK